MSKLSDYFIDKIVQNCLDLFNSLPKNGKPIEKEWTVLSCFVKYDKCDKNIEVVSLGTGSKCIGATKLSAKGDILNDSHAEVIARRGFLLYLYENILQSIKGEKSIFIMENEQIKLKESIEFIFYSSQLPCGDASIIPKSGEEEQYGETLKLQKRPAVDKISNIDIKKQKMADDIHRTGAKCLPHGEQDPKQSGPNYHLLGKVRTKPGRGDRTLSVSCSDKIAKWIYMGVQGSLIDIICGPIYLKHFIYGGGVPYSEESLYRALLNRNLEYSINLNIEPKFYQTSLVFPCIKTTDSIRPAPATIVWVRSDIQILEVAVQGKKLGLTRKTASSPSASLCISKYNMYRKFLSILKINSSLRRKLCMDDNYESIPYNVMKTKSERYLQKWLEIKNKFFKTWTEKPDIWDFHLNASCSKNNINMLSGDRK